MPNLKIMDLQRLLHHGKPEAFEYLFKNCLELLVQVYFYMKRFLKVPF